MSHCAAVIAVLEVSRGGELALLIRTTPSGMVAASVPAASRIALASSPDWPNAVTGADAKIAAMESRVRCHHVRRVVTQYIERIRDNHILGSALSCITAAVVGVILNLAVWFSLHTLFADVAELHAGSIRLLLPDWRSLDYVATGIAAGAFMAIFKLHWSVFRTLGVACIFGLILHSLSP